MKLSDAFRRVSREHDRELMDLIDRTPDPEVETAPSAPPTPIDTGITPSSPPAPTPPASGPVTASPDVRAADPVSSDPTDLPPVAQNSSGPETDPDATVAAPPPDGIGPDATGLVQTEAQRAADLTDLRVKGSIIDGGSAQDMLDGKYPKPSVMSQREIDRLNRIRMTGLDLSHPFPWPDFIPYPSEAELRVLTHPDTTPELIRAFEVAKQREADDMAARAAEINAWIFASGTMRLNEEAQMRRAARRDAALRERNENQIEHDKRKTPINAEDISDLDLYGDHFYGIKFAMLLNPDPANITRLRTAPVASWGHDQLITLDGGRIRAREGELIVTSVSAQAAQMLVMEAKARGWETIKISGHNEFCSAVKAAAKQAGLGAIIYRRGPLGIGPFSRPEVIMPPIPQSRVLVPGQGGMDKERREAAVSVPNEDVEAANALSGLEKGNREVRAKRQGVLVKDPLAAGERSPEKDDAKTTAPVASAPET
jgi:hypothetical protein